MKYNHFIDHTNLKATSTKEIIETLCEEAKKNQFASVCVNPYWVKYANSLLHGSIVKVCTVIGFPLGANTTNVKIFETLDAIKNGASEIDMVINVGEIKDGNWNVVLEEIEGVVKAAKNKIVKVIIETCYLTVEEVEMATKIVVKAGADFVKTSTGFGTGGATVENVILMKKLAGNKGVKASGGIKTYEDMKKLIDAGATRIGTSNGVALVQQKKW